MRRIGSPDSQVFRIPALDGSCAPGALGRAGCVSPRSANLRTAATPHKPPHCSPSTPISTPKPCWASR